MEAPWINSYQPKDWAVYVVQLPSEDYTSLTESIRPVADYELFSCGAESQAAADHWKRTGDVDRLFFYDLEQLWAMNFDVV